MRIMGLLLLLTVFVTGDVFAQVRVKGYYRKNGTYVAPHYRSSPNSSRLDNYSSRGNYNPYTGKRGTVNPYASSSVPAQPTYALPAPQYPLWRTPSPTAPRTNRWWATEPAQDAGSIESARSEIRALEAGWKQTDPFYEQRISVLRARLDAISLLPPSQWAPTLEREYWAIPATKTSPLTLSLSILEAMRSAPRLIRHAAIWSTRLGASCNALKMVTTQTIAAASFAGSVLPQPP